jgi:hypothetical protein
MEIYIDEINDINATGTQRKLSICRCLVTKMQGKIMT